MMTIKANTEQNDLQELYIEMMQNIDKIEKIELDDTELIGTSAIISMILSFKKNQNIEVPKLKNNSIINGLGKIIIKE